MTVRRPLVWITRYRELPVGDTIDPLVLDGAVAGDATVFLRKDGTWSNTLYNPVGGVILDLITYNVQGTFTAKRYNGTLGAETPLLNGNIFAAFAGTGYNGAAMSSNTARMRFVATGTWSTTSLPCRIDFSTVAVGSTSSTVRWNIESEGHFTPGASNTYDIGGATNLVRAVYASTQAPGTADNTLATTAFVGAAITAGGSFYQPLDGTLTALAGQNWVLNSMPVGSGTDTVAQLALAANTFPARSSTGDVAAKPVTDYAFTLLDDINAAAARATLVMSNTDSVTFWSVTAQVAMFTPYLHLTPGNTPGAVSNGDLWYYGTGNSFRGYANGAIVDMWHSAHAPASVTGVSTNTAGVAGHSHFLDMQFNTAALADVVTGYPNGSVSHGTITAGIAAGLTNHITWQSTSNRVGQFLHPVSGGSTIPEVYFRSNHVSSGGGGWTAPVRLWHDGNQLALGTSATTARTALGLGTAAVENIGTSGATVPLLSGANTHSGATNFTDEVRVNGNPNVTNSVLMAVEPTLQSGVVTAHTSFRSTLASAAASFNTPTITHFNVQAWTPGSGHTVTTQYGFRAAVLTAATTNYSFWCANSSVAGNCWNFYANGASPNYFAGKHLIGDTVDYGPMQQVATVGSTQPTMASSTMASWARSTSAGSGVGIALIGGNTGIVGINFGDTDDEDAGTFSYDHSTNQFNLRINAVSARYQFLSNYMLLPATPAALDNSLKAASTAYVDAAVAAVSAMVKLGTATVSGAAATTLTLSGLNLSAYNSFYVEFALDNATASLASLSLYFNSDTTATNYYSQTAVNDGTANTAARANTGALCSMEASETATGTIRIKKDRDGKPRSFIDAIRAAPASINLQRTGHVWNSATNVTGITVSSSVASSLAIGCTFTVYGVLP